jgi:hypothetical protein
MPDSCSHDDLQARIHAYLVAELEEGRFFVKSRYIAADLDISVKRVGAAMKTLESTTTDLSLQRWGGQSDGITWYIEPANSEG